MSSPGRPNPMFTIGPYAHETQLVTPPVFSTFTTEPSTAPFTPPPELAHLTTPSSPDVPFAQYVSSTLEAKRATGETISPFSTSTLASPCDTPVGYTPTSGRHYLGSPAGQLMSPTMGSFSGELISHGKYYLYSSAYAVKKGSSFPTYDPLASANMDGVPCASFLLSNESSTKREEASPPSIVQLDLIDEHGVRTLHQKPSNTAMYELSAGSLSEDNTNLMAHKHGILLHQQSGEKSSELQMDAGRSSKEDLSNGIVPLKAAKNSGINCNHVGDENDGSSAAVSSSECIKKGDILQEYVAHKCNERGVLQYETELCVEP
ncbi:hypothetical protein KP509_07G069900 [Ceratopteris richardii]|nr:hypothetical protein KP509_07G069900 [Ceratopteris richardii]